MSNNTSDIDGCSVSSSINNKSNSGGQSRKEREISVNMKSHLVHNTNKNIIEKDLNHNLNRRQAKVMEI
ncbi:1645_t:CDS:2 [Gigaspora margarita]|uniref:1645_t:CDS:1 n=1 Tax=Gigaspora margarita TaxID=4874 RepID=A0ABN7W5B7_GIGMA|nr:1645_t:CDS:2 [Gigaspora margarita]